MKKEDNRDIQFRHLTMDNVRLSNEVARLESHVDFLTEKIVQLRQKPVKNAWLRLTIGNLKRKLLFKGKR